MLALRSLRVNPLKNEALWIQVTLSHEIIVIIIAWNLSFISNKKLNKYSSSAQPQKKLNDGFMERPDPDTIDHDCECVYIFEAFIWKNYIVKHG